ncbi:MAG: ShlB/FhaC/HecB family hemolysin secretion/activation protein [Betaproteobacteria bacterium]|nr:ShlB/FhaC/HecB family hemolysin secretion/activation protein [Betaproteobacteria bacterium]
MIRKWGASTVRTLLPAVCLTALVSHAVTVTAQDAAVPPPHFDISRFDVQGNTLLKPEEIERAVAPYTGAGRDFADVQRALEALEQSYRDRGYSVVQVVLPEQDITRGVVQFRVVQPRVGRVSIEGNTRFDADNIRGSLPTIREGATPNSKEIARNLLLAGEHPVKQTNVLLRSGASEDQIDVRIKVADDKPWRVFLSADNTGTPETGDYRAGIGFQHANLFNRDHSLTAQFVTSPDRVDDVQIYGFGYRIPLYRWNAAFDLIAGYSDVNSGVVQGLFNVSGSGAIFGARFSYFLPKWGEVEQKLAIGLDYRAFKNEVLFSGQAFVPDITIHPLSLTYSGLLRMAAAEFSYYGSVARNIPGGNDGQEEDFRGPKPGFPNGARAGADADYVLSRYGANYVRSFRNDWQMRAGFNAQHTGDALVSGEQFGAGGQDSVRAFRLREATNDKGYVGTLELYTPDFGARLGWEGVRARVLAFFDIGQLRRNNAQPDEVARENLSSVGVGLRLGKTNAYSFRLDVGQVLDGAGSRTQNDIRVNASAVLIY